MSFKANHFVLSLFVCLLTGCNFDVVIEGEGRVVSDPAGIDCSSTGGNCTVESYEKLGDGNDEVITTLTAYPAEGQRLAGWIGCDNTHHHQCYKLMEGNIEITAIFEPVPLAATEAPAETVRFVALGDFGEGNLAQEMVGNAMQAVCDEAGGCDFAIGLGDNIYDENPQSVYEDVFERKFEFPYRNVQFPFYMSLGNHDNSLIFDGLGGFNHSGEVQVAYTYRTDKMSQKWQMPARYYTHTHPKNKAEKLVDFFVLDSNPMITPLDINPEYETNLYKKLQGEWFDSKLAGSVATWKIAYTHHPYISNGQHGNAGLYDGVPALDPALTARISGETYRKWFEQHVCGKVDVFFAGHDHELQVLKSVPECGNTYFVISGAGAKSRDFADRNRNQVWYQQDNRTGFVMAEIAGNTMTISVYLVDGTTGEYENSFVKSFPRRDLTQ